MICHRAFVPALAVLSLASASSITAQTSLTIYNDGRVLVRRTVTVPVAKGTSSQRVALGALDPASLFSLDSGVTITGFDYDGAVDEASVLRRSIGRRVVFRLPESKDTLSALVLGVDPLRLQLPDGRVSFSAPGAGLYPSDVVVADPSVSLQLHSARAVDRLRLGYFTAGASWRASYQVMLGDAEARVSGMAVLQSESLRAENAEVQLLAGAVGRAEAGQPPPAPVAGVMFKAQAADEARAVAEQKVGEYHLYTLSGRSTLLPGLTTSVALFDPVQVKYERNYVVHGSLPFWGFLPQQGEEAKPPVEVSYTLKRPRKTEFGDRPLPGGIARLFLPDSSGRSQLVGEAALEHTPAGEELRLVAGNAFDLTARRVQTTYVTRRDSSKAGWRTLATADYRVTLRNAGDSAAAIDVEEERGGEWSIVSSSVPGEKLSSTRTRFRVRVPARGEAVLTYRVRVVW
ncbi:MAG TPA: hypothetical protein VH763_09065 [Gemmatimonadales bacterium]|jgi:hypothetical protein